MAEMAGLVRGRLDGARGVGMWIVARRQGRNGRLVSGATVSQRARGDARRQLYAGNQAVRDARGALSVWPLRAAGDAGGCVRQLAAERAGRATAALDRFIRTYPNHPN